MNLSKKIILLFLIVTIPGCGIIRRRLPPLDYYYINEEKDLTDIARVMVVELNNNSPYTQVSNDITEQLFQAIQKKQLFGVSTIKKQNPEWLKLNLDPDRPYSLQQLAAARNTLNCDAFLLGTVTTYKPFPHLVIGLRLKIIDLTDGRLLWAIEQVWDTADKITQKRGERYFQRRIKTGETDVNQHLIDVSSIKFIKFISYETAETLTP